MKYFLSDNELAVKELFANYSNKRIIPLRKSLDESDDFPTDVFREMAGLDFFRVMIPEEYSGVGESHMNLILAIEELSRGEAGIGVTFAVNAIATKGILLFGSEDQKTKYIPEIADGKILTAFAITEPEAGSDVANLKTKAIKKDDKYILSGVKRFITNGSIADLYMVIASTNPDKGYKGFSAFIVEKGTNGLSYGKKENKMGIRSSVTCELIFDNCEVSEKNLVGSLGQGFYIAMELLNRSRIGIGAQSVGIAQAAFDEAMTYSGKRKQFNRSINSFQAVQIMLADMATQIEAARLLVYYAAKSVDLGEKDITKISAMSKLFASDVAMKVTTDAVQIFGGYGYMKEYPVEKFMRDAKVTQIYEGTNQIQMSTIAKELVREKR